MHLKGVKKCIFIFLKPLKQIIQNEKVPNLELERSSQDSIDSYADFVPEIADFLNFDLHV